MSSYQQWKAREAEVAKRNPKLAAAHAEAHAALIRAEHVRSSKGKSTTTERAVEKARKARAELREQMLAIEAAPAKKAATPSPKKKSDVDGRTKASAAVQKGMKEFIAADPATPKKAAARKPVTK